MILALLVLIPLVLGAVLVYFRFGPNVEGARKQALLMFDTLVVACADHAFLPVHRLFSVVDRGFSAESHTVQNEVMKKLFVQSYGWPLASLLHADVRVFAKAG